MALFIWVIRTSILASILVVFILFLKVLLRDRLGPKWHYYIWFLVLLRLIIPIDLQSPVSIYNYFSTPRIASVTNDLFNSHEPVVQPQDRIREGWESGQGISIPPGTLPRGSDSFEAEPLPLTPEVNTLSLSVINIAFYLWLAGVVILALHIAIINIEYWNAIRRKEHVNDRRVLQLLEECKEKLGINKRITLVQTVIVKTITLYGFMQPRILLPSKMNDKLFSEELRYIIYHELSHIKQKDIAINIVTGFLQILHWFNPILWYGFFRMRQDREVACDALALSYLHPQEYKNYGKVIIDLIETYSKPVQLPGMIGIVNDGSNMKKRVSMISLFKKGSNRISIAAIVLFLAFGVIFLTNSNGGLEVSKRGNTVGNLINGGTFAEEDGWIYYSNYEDQGLFRTRLDGGDSIRLSPDPWVGDINVLDSWVYYVSLGDGGRLYRMKTEGWQRTPLNDHNSFDVQVIGDTIYYATIQESNLGRREKHLIRMDLDGGNSTVIAVINPQSPVIVEDGWVYYTHLSNETDTPGLYRMRTDGSGLTLVSEQTAYMIHVVDGWVYYANEEGIHRVKPTGRNYNHITKARAGFIHVNGDWIYFNELGSEVDVQYFRSTGEGSSTSLLPLYSESRGGNLYRIKTDGIGRDQITSDQVLNIYILDNMILYLSVTEGMHKYIKINENGDFEGEEGYLENHSWLNHVSTTMALGKGHSLPKQEQLAIIADLQEFGNHDWGEEKDYDEEHAKAFFLGQPLPVSKFGSIDGEGFIIEQKYNQDGNLWYRQLWADTNVGGIVSGITVDIDKNILTRWILEGAELADGPHIEIFERIDPKTGELISKQVTMHISGLKEFEEFGTSNFGSVSINTDENALTFGINTTTVGVTGAVIDGPRVYFKMDLATYTITDKVFEAAPNEEIIELTDKRMIAIGKYYEELIMETESN